LAAGSIEVSRRGGRNGYRGIEQRASWLGDQGVEVLCRNSAQSGRLAGQDSR